MLRRDSFYARHRELQRRQVRRRLQRDLPELQVSEPPDPALRAAAAVAAGLPLVLLLSVLLARA